MHSTKNKCCIVIPIYKIIPDQSELASLRNAIKLLKNYKFCFICARDLSVNAYIDSLKQFNELEYSFMRFENRFFSSLEYYNKLLLSKSFYQKFEKFEYILIYQLDAWVFKDELEYWCIQEYDYIGAPWFEGLHLAGKESKFTGVGNGGFSLRKVKTFLKVLHSFIYIVPVRELWKLYLEKVTIKSTLGFLKRLTFRNNTFFLLNNYNFQEDYFWGFIVSKRCAWYKVPDKKTASRFSMEVNARLLYEMNEKQLPFGCHAWEKYDPGFWNEFIKI